jgi:glycosyltransferase involved in cell wall biosynthesis
MVLFVGRLEMRKGIDILLSAASEFLAADEHTYLIVAGRDVEGWVEKSKAMISADISERIIFLGEVDDGTREKLLHAAYCLIFPSRYESFGLVPLEAFVHGVPVIASRSGAIPEVVCHELSGLLFNADDAASLAASVLRLARDSELRKQLASGAKQQIRQFSGRNSAIRTVQLYSEILSDFHVER